MPNDAATPRPPAPGQVQSLHRALDLLELVAAQGGHMPIGEIAARAAVPLPTAHRLLKTLVERGYMRQLPNRHYALGFRLVPLGMTANTMLWADARPVLELLVGELGETANLAVLSDSQAEYVAQVPSPHSMRMFTEVGRKVALHSTGVGKALLAQIGTVDAQRIVRSSGLPPATTHTIVTEDALMRELDSIRSANFAVDDEEQEYGVRCVAVPLRGKYLSPMAISVSGPVARVDDQFMKRAIPLLQSMAARLTREMQGRGEGD